MAFFAIAFVHGFIEQNQLLLKIIGGAFVVVVGLYIFFQNPVVQIRRNRSGKVSLWRDFLSIFLFTIANPAISLVFVGLFAMFGISNDAGYINGVAMLVGVLAGLPMVVPVYVRAEHLPQTLSSPIPALDEPHRRHPYHPAGSDGDNLFPIQYPFR